MTQNALTRNFRRSRTDRMLFGVCGGAARLFGIDAAIVRIGLVALTLFTGVFPGVVLYAACALIVPEEDLI